MANDNGWNISENENTQNILSDIIEDYIDKNNCNNKQIPEYIQMLFAHYCANKGLPSFNNIHKIYDKMTTQLKLQLLNDKQTICNKKIQPLFPNAVSYIDDQGTQMEIDS
eukprot:875292_1